MMSLYFNGCTANFVSKQWRKIYILNPVFTGVFFSVETTNREHLIGNFLRDSYLSIWVHNTEQRQPCGVESSKVGRRWGNGSHGRPHQATPFDKTHLCQGSHNLLSPRLGRWTILRKRVVFYYGQRKLKSSEIAVDMLRRQWNQESKVRGEFGAVEMVSWVACVEVAIRHKPRVGGREGLEAELCSLWRQAIGETADRARFCKRALHLQCKVDSRGTTRQQEKILSSAVSGLQGPEEPTDKAGQAVDHHSFRYHPMAKHGFYDMLNRNPALLLIMFRGNWQYSRSSYEINKHTLD